MSCCRGAGNRLRRERTEFAGPARSGRVGLDHHRRGGDQVAQGLRVRLCLRSLDLVLGGGLVLPRLARLFAHLVEQAFLLVQRADGALEGVLHSGGLQRFQHPGGKRVARMAAVTRQTVEFQFPQRAVAFRAGEGGSPADFLQVFHIAIPAGDLVFDIDPVHGAGRLAHGKGVLCGAGGRQFDQRGGNLVQAQRAVDVDVPERAGGHIRRFGLGRVLHDGEPAARLDRLQTDGAVVQVAGQDDADRAGAKGGGGGAEQRIDRRTAVVFLGTVHQARVDARAVGDHGQVGIGRGQQHPPREDRLAVDRMAHRQRRVAAEDLGQHAAVRADVCDDQYCSGKVRRQRCQKNLQRTERTKRSADDDNPGHGRSRSW
jgi:hypothetical protein